MERHNYYAATVTPAAGTDPARIVTGKLRIEPSLVDLFPALEATLYTAHSAAEAKGITLVANFGPLPEKVLGDSTRLRQVVWNLLTNAVRFTQNRAKQSCDVVDRSDQKNLPQSAQTSQRRVGIRFSLCTLCDFVADIRLLCASI